MNGDFLQRPAKVPQSGSETSAFTRPVSFDNFDKTTKLILQDGGQVAMPRFATLSKRVPGLFY